MPIHPIAVVNRVVEEYRDYLHSEFHAKDPALLAALERELDRPQFLAQEPFYQAHRPFRHGRRWRDLPLDATLAKVMEDRARAQGSSTPEYAFLHQSQAIEELLSPAPRPVVVTTGTSSGKTEAFLLPVLQNALLDATHFTKPGLTAILVYPMNALGNDQLERIRAILDKANLSGTITAEQYNRGTSQTERERLRLHPPHILLTNYMMLEYLLVRPSDREALFANHRCRYLVLDEVHTYRGILGANIALLVRRLKAHLRRSQQDWRPNPPEDERPRRFPELVPIGTSATIKSLADDAGDLGLARRLRDEAVQEFFSKLTGAEPATIQVYGEELQEIDVPSGAAYPSVPVEVDAPDVADPEAVQRALCRLAGIAEGTPIVEAARRCRLLWDLNRWLVRKPMSASQIAAQLRAEVPARAGADHAALAHEVEAALVVGAALPDGVPGALRLRAHRLIRGGWRFHRCVNPDCGRLHPMGEERCACGQPTAPVYLCRNCGAHYLRYVGDPETGPLRSSAQLDDGPEWMLYDRGRFEDLLLDPDEDGEEAATANGDRWAAPGRMRGRPVLQGSFDPSTGMFSDDETEYALKVVLAPARTRCLCCGATAGSRNIVTPIALGTSAALKVISEGLLEGLDDAHRQTHEGDGKERLLIFSDSRQDAAHQARFMLFASRYDRLRRRLLGLLDEQGALTIQQAVEALGELGEKAKDNPYAPAEEDPWLTEDEVARIRAWEEAPLLDELALTAGYRGTLFNLGLAGIRYHRLDEYVAKRGTDIAAQLAVDPPALGHVCRCILDEMRVRGALSREMLQYHPRHVKCPSHIHAAQWERRVVRPQGYPCSQQAEPLAFFDANELPAGLRHTNPWRREGAGGSSPHLERVLRRLLMAFGGAEPSSALMVALLDFLRLGHFIQPARLYGTRDAADLLQVNAEVIRLEPLTEERRRRCRRCGAPRAFAPLGAPCPQCHQGDIGPWSDDEVWRHRSVRRLRQEHLVPLVAGEHTAQVTSAARSELEMAFKAADGRVNVLACSPTLEMGIDVGGLDAVALRNVPPRPDNYAQRGGRAGRRSRIGLVLGYARSTPHDQYFFDRPEEMIAGEVPAPTVALGNRDVLLRHVNAIVFGAADPGLAGRMAAYVTPTGQVQQDTLQGLLDGLSAQFGHAAELAKEAFGQDILDEGGLDDRALEERLAGLPGRVQDVIDRTQRQVIELRQALDVFAAQLKDRRAGTRAAELVGRLLGISSDDRRNNAEADDRSAGYPLRRFAEFGLLPGYEFPAEPASLRLVGDAAEEDPVTTGRRFGIGQFQPEAQVYARTARWKVVGLDLASPWNPQSEAPSWPYRRCRGCGLRFGHAEPRCPRCGDDRPDKPRPGFEYGGFLARRDESPVMDEEERYAVRNVVRCHPQWNGEVVGRWACAGSDGWQLRLSRREEVRWLNEGREPTATDLKEGRPLLDPDVRGYLLCGACGALLSPELPDTGKGKGARRRPRSGKGTDPFGHRGDCRLAGVPSSPCAIVTAGETEVLRLVVPVPAAVDAASWGWSLGYALRIGMRRHFVLDGSEVDFELEGPWDARAGEQTSHRLALTFIDTSLGGSGYLRRAAAAFDRVAAMALEHLAHDGCDTACYRCLKSYTNQRHHDLLNWTIAAPVLEALAAAGPQPLGAEAGDRDDPQPWLEAFAEGVGSPLELTFWRLFQTHGFEPAKQVPVAPAEGASPISVADFAVQEARLAIYVDGASVHVGVNARRDRRIRERLLAGRPPWQVVVLTAADLNEGAALVERLRAAAAQTPAPPA